MIRIRNIKISIENDNSSFISKKISKILHISNDEIIKISINKKSLDARKKDNLFYVYELDLSLKNEQKILKKYKSKDLFEKPIEEYVFPKQHANIESPIIVGSGPAGLFSAYVLAEHGYKPIVIERGEMIE